ncbi:MAG: VTT domain-containing protein [Thermodesulfobacteriota bacterium]
MDLVSTYLARHVSGPIFLLLMLILPLVGFPFSVFLVLAGVHFGLAWGMLLTWLILPLHMSICFFLTRTFVRRPLIRFLERRGYKPPALYVQRPGLVMVSLLLLPGPPYILKTYLMALTGLPYPSFLLLNWGTESLMTLPVVALGGAAAEGKWNLFWILLALLCLTGVYRYRKKLWGIVWPYQGQK